MASPIRCFSRLDEPEFTETRIRCFATQARAKKLKDNEQRGRAKLNN